MESTRVYFMISARTCSAVRAEGAPLCIARGSLGSSQTFHSGFRYLITAYYNSSQHAHVTSLVLCDEELMSIRKKPHREMVYTEGDKKCRSHVYRIVHVSKQYHDGKEH